MLHVVSMLYELKKKCLVTENERILKLHRITRFKSNFVSRKLDRPLQLFYYLDLSSFYCDNSFLVMKSSNFLGKNPYMIYLYATSQIKLKELLLCELARKTGD